MTGCILQRCIKKKKKKLPSYYGLPQVSILGPVLYITYTNDLPFNSNESGITSVLFDDDLVVILAN